MAAADEHILLLSEKFVSTEALVSDDLSGQMVLYKLQAHLIVKALATV